MARGDPIIQILREMPTATSPAETGIEGGGSSPNEQLFRYIFPDALTYYVDLLCRLDSNYPLISGPGFTFTLYWGSAANGGTMDCEWEMAIRRWGDDVEDIDSSHTYVYNSVTARVPTAVGEIAYNDIVFTDGSDSDNIARGDMFILRVRRNGGSGNDDATGDCYLYGVVGKET